MILRVARHTNKLEELTSFYVAVFGLKVLGYFKNHDGYDGIFLGKENLDWHLEFTTSKDSGSGSPGEEDLLIFYARKQEEYDNIVKNISTLKLKMHEPLNPYWKKNGILVKDPDGYGVIICNSKSGTV